MSILERFRRNMLCKTIIKLLSHATISKCLKVIDFFKTNLKSSIYSGPHYDFEMLNEKFRSCILQLLYIIKLFQILKKIRPKQKVQTSENSTSHNAYIIQKSSVLFQNDWMKPVGGNAFNTYHILYYYFKKSPKNWKKNVRSASQSCG